MINRKEDQGQQSIDDIKKEKSDAKVEWEGCDLGSLKDVKQVFTSLRERLDRCDLVCQDWSSSRGSPDTGFVSLSLLLVSTPTLSVWIMMVLTDTSVSTGLGKLLILLRTGSG